MCAVVDFQGQVSQIGSAPKLSIRQVFLVDRFYLIKSWTKTCRKIDHFTSNVHKLVGNQTCASDIQDLDPQMNSRL